MLEGMRRVLRCILEAVEGVEAWSFGAPDARCRREDVEVWRCGALKLWRRAVGVAMWKHRGVSFGALEACRSGTIEVRSLSLSTTSNS